jgi:hypothetical protein
MKKVLVLTLCLMLVPSFAFSYCFGKSGVVKETIFTIQLLSPGAEVDLIDLSNPGPAPTTYTALDGSYAVSKTVTFPPTKLFILQKWYLRVAAGLTNTSVRSPGESRWTFNRANPCETKSCVENFNIEFNFQNCPE